MPLREHSNQALTGGQSALSYCSTSTLEQIPDLLRWLCHILDPHFVSYAGNIAFRLSF